ncbi:DUF4340 domain-containing protein [Defluviitalea phaphyphila]|uniref:DUF4340 domain-containing protein n=1 Tax=Defluviitalea phaphyphila TaxID=1473580 RepID=UPI0007311A94|nr:DUF4340 domain-containing protein [Defluviitalea phaphyphila]
MKKSKNLILSLIFLAILIGIYLYINNKPQVADNNDNNEDSENIELSDINKDDIIKMILTSEEEIIFEKKDDEWEIVGEEINIDQDKVESIASSFALIYATRIVEENPVDLSKYGLNSSEKVIAKAVLKDGSEKEFYLGNKTPDGKSYYCMQENDNKVYLIPTIRGDKFNFKINDIREKSLVKIDTSKLKYLLIKEEGKPTIEIVSNEEDTKGKEYGIGLWIMKQPYINEHTINTENFNKVLDGLGTISIKDFVVDNPSDLSEYGLENPRMEIKMQDEENTLHILIGDNKDEDTVYFKNIDENIIYTMDSSTLESFEINPFDIISKFVYIPNIDTVSNIYIEANEKTYSMSLTRTIKEAEKEEDEDETITTYKVNNKEVKEEDFKKYYQELIGITYDAEIDKNIRINLKEIEPEVKTIFTLTNGEKVSIEYIPYNEELYAPLRDGNIEFVVSKKKVDNMLETLEKLISSNNK